MGTLQKKRKGKKKKTNNNQVSAHDNEVTATNMVGPTDDEASNLQIANPDSFIGNSSAQNFNKSPINRNAAISPKYSSSRNQQDKVDQTQ